MKETVQWLKQINVNVVLGLIAAAGLIFAFQDLTNTVRVENEATRAEFRAEISDVRTEISDVRSEIADLRVDMVGMESRLTASFDERLDAVEREQSRLQGLYDSLPK